MSTVELAALPARSLQREMRETLAGEAFAAGSTAGTG
jgi:hypothetical protein